MPQVIVEQPNMPPMTIPLSGDETRFGRAEDNDVVLVADEVSRHHAVLRRHGAKMLLRDLNSLNGTYVNRQRIVERVLSHMDEIWFGGKCRLVYRDDTMFGSASSSGLTESKLINDVNKIRAELDRAGNNLTLIAESGRTPLPEATLAGAVLPTPDDLITMGRAYRRLSALYRASKLIASDFDLSKRLSDVLDTAIEVMGADRGFILLHDETAKRLRVSVAREMGQELAASSPSMGIAGTSAIDGVPVLMGSSIDDSEFGMRESIIRQRITSAMAVPLRIEDRILGSIYVDSRKPNVTFNEEDLELFVSLATQLAMAIDNVRLYERMLAAEKKRSNLSRFLSPAIVDEIMKEDSVLELGGQKRMVTTLFCDIRGFTPIAERIPARLMVDLLNEHFTAMTEIVFTHQGTLDKYIGDEIMAVFGAPLSTDDDAGRAVRAAIAIQQQNAKLNEQRAADGRPIFHLGIGINSGEVIAGYIGSPMRMEFTVVGDHVNTARRLCDLAKPGQIIVGGSTHELIKDRVESRAIGSVALEGKANPVNAFEIIGLKE
ncbi:MAG TPA: adenylate/guanylate cyclase domain-containing protein [Candidatus Hydrogenedentes bacterium]|nr:adenylate/guanylate cyclase domain-containing protein [Candidatus Hydrogenedentota bacterium]HRT19001.1 adenylate/guanylate cyclase domain-containing protein [Candidatus Hydrogenedentota bacterium]HRT65643.1 adenylate/guanylate cyclase domain-containing protein [Candidatus Hydrogenedentota bacterium]